METKQAEEKAPLEPSFLKEKIEKATETVYQEIGQEKGIEPEKIYYSRQCESVTERLLDKLREEGIAGELGFYSGWDITSHQVVILGENDPTLVDPLWQQFLPHPSTSLPKVFISTKSNLPQTLTQLGIPPEQHHIWLQMKIISKEN